MTYYSLYNRDMKHFNRMFPAGSDLEAKALVRNVLINSEESRHELKDASLYSVCEFNDATASVKPKKKLICHVEQIPIPNKEVTPIETTD